MIGLGAAAGRIEFDNQAIDTINFLSCRVGVGLSTPIQLLQVHEGSSAGALVHVTNDTTGITSADGLDVGINANEQAVIWNHEATDMLLATSNLARLTIQAGGNVGVGAAAPGSLMEWNMATEDLEFVNAGSAGATEQDWIEVQVGGVTGYIRVYAAP